MSGPRILLDIDGVLADFVSGVCWVRGLLPATVYAEWPAGTYDMVEVLGTTQEEFWARIDSAGERFWAELKPYGWATELYERLSSLAPVTLLTSPSFDPASASGKLRWIQGVFGRDFRDYLIGPAKVACAHRDAILVDDFEQNVDAFRNAGGRAILFPRMWNRDHANVGDPLKIVFEKLDELL